ncbi:RHS repeat-associated core domain-containing protein [Streptomyces mirabilis]|uniref:RHS repeat-associated core domain-containing protein n=1 Tax=Streptomyces mirabilis TaxID=68239 RepID=UPI003F4D5C0B
MAVRTSTGSLQWQVTDAHDTAETAVDATTQTAVRRRLDPFGNTRGAQPASGTWLGDKGFVNGIQDTTTGLTHLGAREYDPTIGRFVSADPLLELTDAQQIDEHWTLLKDEQALVSGVLLTARAPMRSLPATRPVPRAELSGTHLLLPGHPEALHRLLTKIVRSCACWWGRLMRNGIGVVCRGCGWLSDWEHSRYVRQVAGEAVDGRSVVIDWCGACTARTPTAPRSTFVEQVPRLTVRYQYRNLTLQKVTDATGLGIAAVYQELPRRRR